MINKSKFSFVNINNQSYKTDTPLRTKEIGYYKDSWNRFKKNKGALFAFYIISLIITDINGCQDTVDQVISIALLPVLPTGFTPNGDNENDIFIIRGGPFKSVDFKIYNNWGQLIYSSADANEGWDGTYQSENAPMGVYTWTFSVEMTNGQVIKKSGDVTLMR